MSTGHDKQKRSWFIESRILRSHLGCCRVKKAAKKILLYRKTTLNSLFMLITSAICPQEQDSTKVTEKS